MCPYECVNGHEHHKCMTLNFNSISKKLQHVYMQLIFNSKYIYEEKISTV